MNIPNKLSTSKLPGIGWAEKLRKKHLMGETLIPIQIAKYQEALRIKGKL